MLNSAESNQYKICAESKHNEPCILWPHTGWAISQAERRKRKRKTMRLTFMTNIEYLPLKTASEFKQFLTGGDNKHTYDSSLQTVIFTGYC